MIAPPLIALGYLLARVRLAAGHPGEDERWLLFPALILGHLGGLVVLLLWPFRLSIVLGGFSGFIDRLPDVIAPGRAVGSFGYWFDILGAASILAGAWWILLGTLTARHPGPVRWLMRPFLQDAIPALARALIPVGVLAVVVGFGWLMFQPL